MSRPGEKITRKTLRMAQKMKNLGMEETSSKSLLTNVLGINDDFRATTLPHDIPVHHPSHVTSHQNSSFVRSSGQLTNGEGLKKSTKTQYSGVYRELGAILKEIKVITEKIKDDEESSTIEGDWKFAAMVLDRMCLVFFSAFTIVATLSVLAVAPHVIVY